MINEALAKDVRQALRLVREGLLEDVTSEIQDDSSFLFLTCKIPFEAAAPLSKELRTEIVKTLNHLLLPRPNQELGCWQLNVYHDGGLEDAIFPFDL